MTSTHQVPKKITAILAIVFLIPAIYIFAVWLQVYSGDTTPAQKVEAFIAHFPSFITEYKWIIYFSMACCLAAMVLAAKSFKQPLLSLRITMWLVVMTASLIFFVDVFQLF